LGCNNASSQLLDIDTYFIILGTLINTIVVVHMPMNLGGLSEVGAGFFEGGAVGELGTVGVGFLGGGEEKLLVDGSL